MKISIIIPTLNEEKNIEKAILTTERFIEKNLKSENVQFIISDAQSKDKTQEIIQRYQRKYSNLKVKKIPFRGRGYQVAKTILDERADFFIYMDCDLATPLEHLLEIIKYLNRGYDIVIGSRYLQKSRAKRTFKRNILGKGYIFLVKLLFFAPFSDYQCGFKGFKKETILPILKEM